MSFAKWYWRLWALLASLVTAHVLAISLLIFVRRPAAVSIGELCVVAAISIGIGGLVTWVCLRRLFEPLFDLSRHILSVAGGDRPLALAPDQDEVSVLTHAVDQMQHDLAGRLGEVQNQSQRLESVLSNMAEGVLAAAPDTTILLANDSARALLDFATASPVGRPLLEVTRARPVSEALSQALRTVAPVEMEFESPGASRRTLGLRATCLPGKPCPGVLIVVHDLTEMRRLENLRRELVANVSHELKTPLSAIKGYAETLRLGAVNDPEHNVLFLRRIEEQADRLHELILDMLQLARLESGQEAFEFMDVNVAEILTQVVEQFAATAAGKQIALSLELPDDEVVVQADEDALQAMVNNLVDNALKYTASGGRVAVRVVEGPTTLAMEVEDTGVGIPEAELARIFERFYRVDKARSRELGGTGLGLSIVKHLAQAHGGAVSVMSEVGKGSTFRVELPRRAAAAKGRRSRAASAVSD
jgi:two-component system phosphate regulon sensor histidine kinase PhoR